MNIDTSGIITAAQRPSHFFREFRAEQRRSAVAGWKFLKAGKTELRRAAESTVKGQFEEMRKHAWATRLKLTLGSIFNNSQGFAGTLCPWGHFGEDKAGANQEFISQGS